MFSVIKKIISFIIKASSLLEVQVFDYLSDALKHTVV